MPNLPDQGGGTRRTGGDEKVGSKSEGEGKEKRKEVRKWKFE